MVSVDAREIEIHRATEKDAPAFPDGRKWRQFRRRLTDEYAPRNE